MIASFFEQSYPLSFLSCLLAILPSSTFSQKSRSIDVHRWIWIFVIRVEKLMNKQRPVDTRASLRKGQRTLRLPLFPPCLSKLPEISDVDFFVCSRFIQTIFRV
jgi:hypothetical protein